MWGVLAPHIPLQLMSYYSGPQGEILQSLIFNWKPDCLTSVSLRVHIYQKSVITARCRRVEGGDGGGDNVTLYYNTKVTMPQCLALLMVNKNFPFPRSSQSIWPERYHCLVIKSSSECPCLLSWWTRSRPPASRGTRQLSASQFQFKSKSNPINHIQPWPPNVPHLSTWLTCRMQCLMHCDQWVESAWPNRNGTFLTKQKWKIFCILSLPLGPVTVSYLKASLAKRWDQNLYGRIIAVNLGYRSMRKFLVFQRYKLW